MKRNDSLKEHKKNYIHIHKNWLWIFAPIIITTFLVVCAISIVFEMLIKLFAFFILMIFGLGIEKDKKKQKEIYSYKILGKEHLNLFGWM